VIAPRLLFDGGDIFGTSPAAVVESIAGGALALTILVSWLIELLEYSLEVAASRIGWSVYSPAQLKVIRNPLP